MTVKTQKASDNLGSELSWVAFDHVSGQLNGTMDQRERLSVGVLSSNIVHLQVVQFNTVLSLNQVPPQLMTSGNAQLVRPFPQFKNVTWINPSIGNSTYHAGFVRAEKRTSAGLSFRAHYTFSKFIDDVEAANEFGTTGSYMDAYIRFSR